MTYLEKLINLLFNELSYQKNKEETSFIVFNIEAFTLLTHLIYSKRAFSQYIT